MKPKPSLPPRLPYSWPRMMMLVIFATMSALPALMAPSKGMAQNS
jgi:hypothetical protein